MERVGKLFFFFFGETGWHCSDNLGKLVSIFFFFFFLLYLCMCKCEAI